MNIEMPDNEENRNKIAQLVAQEVTKDGKIPHFSAEAFEEILFEARRRAGSAARGSDDGEREEGTRGGRGDARERGGGGRRDGARRLGLRQMQPQVTGQSVVGRIERKEVLLAAAGPALQQDEPPPPQRSES